MKAMVYANTRKNYSSEFSALPEASITLQHIVRFQALWSHKSENVFKQIEVTSNSLREWQMALL
jgi:hypothetical protein